MIRREGQRRPSASLILAPTYKGAELPQWSPSAPRSGWTPATGWQAARDYAEEHEGIYTERILATAAYRALLGAVPGLHRADIMARLHHVDVRAAAFVKPDDPAPF